MPNTLAHIGVQSLITRRAMPTADLGWVWLGCLLPDLPWILQRIVTALPLDISAYDLRLYATVQSSLVFSVVGALGFAALAERSRHVASVLALGCLMHLLLDATQTKWANGVLLFAPADWTLLNFGLYWPEDWPSLGLTLAGLVYVAAVVRHARPSPLRLTGPIVPKVAASALLFLAYAYGPLHFMPAAEAADLHFAGTLRDIETRPGKPVVFDRSGLFTSADGSRRVEAWTGDTFTLSGEPIPIEEGTVSLSGRFVDQYRIEVTEFHLHSARRREIFSMAGIGLIAMWWAVSLGRSWRIRKKAGVLQKTRP